MSEHLFKVIVVGDLGSGKSAIIKRYVHNVFSLNYKSTIGVDFALKVVPWEPGVTVRCQLWDIAGQERFGSMTRVYYKEAVGAFVVYDLTRPVTFEGVLRWKKDVDEKLQLIDGSRIPAILLANKADLKRANANQLDEFCKEHGFVAWYETSAKDNLNIDEASRCLIEHMLENEQRLAAVTDEHPKRRITVSTTTNRKDGISKCC